MAIMDTSVYDPSVVGKEIGVFGKRLFSADTCAAAAALNLGAFDVVLIDKYDADSVSFPTIWHFTTSEPSHAIKFQDASGRWYTIIDRIIDVRSLGCVTSSTYTGGIHSRNRVAVQKAIDALSLQGGGQVKLPAGDIYLNRSGNVYLQMKSNVWLKGAGRGITYLKRRGYAGGEVEVAHSINLTDVENVMISDLTVYGKHPEDSTPEEPYGGGHGIRIGGTSEGPEYLGGKNVRIVNVEITRTSYGCGFQTGRIEDVVLDKVWIHGTRNDSIDFKNYGNGANLTATNCLFEDWGQGGTASGSNGTHLRGPVNLINCVYKMPDNISGACIQLEPTDAQGYGAHGTVVQACTLHHGAAGGTGIRCFADDVRVTDTNIFGARRGITQAGKNFTIKGGTIKSAVHLYGIFASNDGAAPADGPVNMNIIGVTVDNVGNSGYGLFCSGSHIKMIGGAVMNCGEAVRQEAGSAYINLDGVSLIGNTAYQGGSGVGVARFINCAGYKNRGVASTTVSITGNGIQTVSIPHDLVTAPSTSACVPFFASGSSIQATGRVVSTSTSAVVVEINVLAGTGTLRVGAFVNTLNSFAA